MERIQASSSGMKKMFIPSVLLVIVCLVGFSFLIETLVSTEALIVLLLAVGLIGFLYYIYKFGAVAYLNDTSIYIETTGGKKYEYNQDKVKKLTYMESGKSSYMHIFIENDSGNVDKFLLGGFVRALSGGKSSYKTLAEIVENNGGELPDHEMAR